MANLQITVNDNTGAVLQALNEKKQLFLEQAGQQAESNAVLNITNIGRVDTGAYRNSMTHTVSGDKAVIGSALSYAVWNEVGTGTFASDGNGRRGWWVYVRDENGSSSSSPSSQPVRTREEALKVMHYLRSKGLDAHITNGIKPTHALRDAISGHEDEYKAILEMVMRQ